jgi:hypothetical protein
MTPQVLLDGLRELLRNQPPLEGRGDYGDEQRKWLGRATALISEWDRAQAIGFRGEARNMTANLNRQANFGSVLTTIHEAIAALEHNLPADAGQVFGPGAAYDFFRTLNELVGRATQSLFIVDPYMDSMVFDGYLANLERPIATRLLMHRYRDSIKGAASTFQTQHGGQIEIRRSADLHDRLIFIDTVQCWVLGASIKDAAAKKPTYLAPLAEDLVAEKLRIYEGLWQTATPI